MLLIRRQRWIREAPIRRCRLTQKVQESDWGDYCLTSGAPRSTMSSSRASGPWSSAARRAAPPSATVACRTCSAWRLPPCLVGRRGERFRQRRRRVTRCLRRSPGSWRAHQPNRGRPDLAGRDRLGPVSVQHRVQRRHPHRLVGCHRQQCRGRERRHGDRVGGWPRLRHQAAVMSRNVPSSGNETVLVSGTAIGEFVLADAEIVSGVATSATVRSGAVQEVMAGGVTNVTTVTRGGTLQVDAGGYASSAVVLSGGFLDI